MEFNNIINDNPASYNDITEGFLNLMSKFIKGYVNTVQPVEITAVNDDGTVNVKPLLVNKSTSGKVLEITEDDYINNIPVLMLYGNNIELSFGVSVGNQGLLIAGQYDITNYKKTKSVSEKTLTRNYSYSDGFYLPMTLTGKNGQVIKLKVGSSSITIKNDGVDIVGDTNITGNVNITGSVVASDTITGLDCLTASGVSLESHTHLYDDTQPNGSPVQKSTQPPTP